MPFSKATDLPALKAHIVGNPRYDGQEPATASTLLNDQTFGPVTRDEINGEELQNAVDATEYLALTAPQRALWASILAAAPIRMSHPNIRTQVDAVFEAGTTTRVSIRGLRTRQGSDLETEFGEGSRCSHRDVSLARNIP